MIDSFCRGRRFTFRALLFLLALGGCQGPPSPSGKELTEFVLGTFCSLTLYEGAPPEIFGQVFTRLREIEEEMSANQEGTTLDDINQKAGLEPVRVSPDLFRVLERALFYAEKSGGAFDPTIGPLVKLWDLGAETPRVPGEEEIRKKLSLVNWRDLVLEKEARTAFLRRPGMALDLGAIAKGYAADEAVALIAGAGLKGAMVNLGGNIFAYGEKPAQRKPGQPWRIGIQDPLESRGAYLGVLELRNASVVTSGVYERFFEEGGRRYHHLLSTETGRPLENGLLSVTIVARASIDADALSTTVFTLGYERGRALIDSLEGVEALFVFDDRRVHLTRGLTGSFTLSGPGYRLAGE